MTAIGRYAFSGCTALANITFGAGMKRIEANAFAGCTAISDARFEKKASWLAFNAGGAGRGQHVGPEINSANAMKMNTGAWSFSYSE